jgi:hypothetical protein
LWLIGKMMAGEGRDLEMEVVMGMTPGIAGGFSVGTLGSLVQGKMIFTDLAAMLGAGAVTALSHLVAGRREYGATDQLGNPRSRYTERLFGRKVFRGRSLICPWRKNSKEK